MIPKTITLITQIDDDTVAKIEITVAERGVGPRDADHLRQPTVYEMDAIADALKHREWICQKPTQ